MVLLQIESIFSILSGTHLEPVHDMSILFSTVVSLNNLNTYMVDPVTPYRTGEMEWNKTKFGEIL